MDFRIEPRYSGINGEKDILGMEILFFNQDEIFLCLEIDIHDWNNLLFFLKETTSKSSISDERIAYSGYNINQNEVYYLTKDFLEMNTKILEQKIGKYKGMLKNKDVIDGISKVKDEQKSEELKFSRGEVLNKLIFLQFNNLEMYMRRKEFVNFRTVCLNMEKI